MASPKKKKASQRKPRGGGYKQKTPQDNGTRWFQKRLDNAVDKLKKNMAKLICLTI